MTECPPGFVVQEFVPPDLYALCGDEAIKLIDSRVLSVLSQMRVDYGPLIINDWHSGGMYRYRGYRPLNCKEGAARSQHRIGCAIDCKPVRTTVDLMRADIIKKARAGLDVYAMIGAIEEGTSWFHFDVRPRINGAVLVFRP